MNGLLIATCVLCVVCIIVGFVRGFIKIVASLAATVATIALVMFLTPYVSEGILKWTPLESVVQEKCINAMVTDETPGIEKETEGIDLEALGITEEDIQNVIGNIEIPREKQIELIEQANMPEIFKDLLLENNNSEVYQALGVTTFGEYIGSYLAKLIADIAAFLLTLFVVTVVVRSIVYALGIIGDLPVIGGLNRVAGGILGMATGLLIIWVAFIVITLLYSTNVGRTCFKDIAASRLLTFLYKNNVLLNFVTKFR